MSTGNTFGQILLNHSIIIIERIGLTVRVGNTGRATSFFDMSADSGIAQPLTKVLVDAGQMVPDWLG